MMDTDNEYVTRNMNNFETVDLTINSTNSFSWPINLTNDIEDINQNTSLVKVEYIDTDEQMKVEYRDK